VLDVGGELIEGDAVAWLQDDLSIQRQRLRAAGGIGGPTPCHPGRSLLQDEAQRAVLDTGDEGGGVEMTGGIRPRLPGQLDDLEAVARSGTRFETTQGDPGDPDGTGGGIRRGTVTLGERGGPEQTEERN